MKRRPLVLVALVGLLVVAMLPAQAALVAPTRVSGTSTCGTVESTGPLSFQILNPPIGTTTYNDGDVAFTLTIASTPSGRPSLAFQIAGGAAHDVILRGNTGTFANNYDYTAGEGSPVSADNGLRAPSGTSLAHVWFCYEAEEPEGEPLPCGETVDAATEEASGSFTRLFSSENCEEEKTAVVDIEEGPEGEDVIVFIPNGDGLSNYSGVLTFFKESSDPSLLELEYDPEDDGTFRDMPACEDATFDEESGELITATIPNYPVETWCFYAVQADVGGSGLWQVTWQVFGVADPRFK